MNSKRLDLNPKGADAVLYLQFSWRRETGPKLKSRLQDKTDAIMGSFHLQPPIWPGAPIQPMAPPAAPQAPFISWNSWEMPHLRNTGSSSMMYHHSAWPPHSNCPIHNEVPNHNEGRHQHDDNPVPVDWLSPTSFGDSSSFTQWGKSPIRPAAPFRKQHPFNNYHHNAPQQGAAAILPWLISMSLASAADISTAPPLPPDMMTTLPDDNGRLHVLYKWKQVDFTFPSPAARSAALGSGDFVPAATLPLGLDVWKDRIFVTLPKWKAGIPATLATVPRFPNGVMSPPLRPYPDWAWHKSQSQLQRGNGSSCDGLTSVFRISIDSCGRLWVLDAGVVKVTTDFQVLCPPQIFVFDLSTDQLIMRYVIPKSQVREGSLFTNIVTDVRNGQCENTYAYASDVLRAGVVVYSWSENNSWRVQHPFFLPDPLHSRYSLDGVTFRWTDGVFGIALGPVMNVTATSAAYAEGGAPGPAGTGPQTPRPPGPFGPHIEGERTVYFHAMSSNREFSVPASILLNGTISDDGLEKFTLLGERGEKGQSSASAMDRRGVLFQNLVTRDAVGCWNSARPYTRAALGEVQRDHERLSFPNDLKVDNEEPQNLWVLSNRLHNYFYRSLDPQDYNFRILTATTEDATYGTVCDPENLTPLPPSTRTCNEEL